MVEVLDLLKGQLYTALREGAELDVEVSESLVIALQKGLRLGTHHECLIGGEGSVGRVGDTDTCYTVDVLRRVGELVEGVLRYPVVVHHDVVHHVPTGTPWAVGLEGLGGGDKCTMGVLTTTQDGDADATPFGSYRLQEDIRLDRRLDIGVRLYIARESLLAPRGPVT